MEYIGEHSDRKVFWWHYSAETLEELPEKNWICFAIEDGLQEGEMLEKFVRTSVQKNILEFKAFGKQSSKLDDFFDGVVVLMELVENYSETNIMTTWHDSEGLASAFWQCFHATCVSEVENEDLTIVCFHLENKSLKEDLKLFVNKFNEGWLPSEED
jgi:hypothetical protein